MKIVRCHKSRFDALIAFIAAWNPVAEHHIGYFGLTPEDIRATLRMFNLPFDRAFHLALRGNRILGTLGADIDREIGRAWLYGPLVALEPAPSGASGGETDGAWAATADALYAAVAARLPAVIREHEMFVDAENRRVRGFAARHNFTAYGEWAVYYLLPDRLAALPAAEAQPWQARYAAQLEALHQRLFPRSNYTLNYMLEKRDEDSESVVLLVDGNGDTLNGYFFGRIEREAGEAYVDLVGVDEAQRGTGLGRRLMLAGLSHMRGMEGIRQVNLTVAAGNEPAIRLYDSLGFQRERNMVAFRRMLGNPGESITDAGREAVEPA